MKGHTIHGHSPNEKQTRTYHAWANMIQRCTNPRNGKYALYGARGIQVCEAWRSFEGFLQDMGVCPEGMMLDRINNEAGYSKSNCRWTDRFKQARNRRNNRFLDHNGTRMTVVEWSEVLGFSYVMLRMRLHRGWTVQRSLEQKARK